ncbi:hypothetical protein CAEBREN_32211, partial [Caenorhabditis brenneri]
MMENCESVEDFDKYYEWFKLNDGKYWNFTIIGNYTEFDNVTIPTLIIPSNREIGKCSPIVEELVAAFSTLISEEPQTFYEKMLEKCKQITKNLTMKRDAFIKKKSYFLEFANTKCIVREGEYLKSKHDHFVDLITVQPANDDCKSVFAETEGYQCLQFHKNATSGHGYWMYSMPDFAVFFSHECQVAE